MPLHRRFLHSGSEPPPPTTVHDDNSDMVVILTTLLCALICMIGLALVARCAWLSRRFSAQTLTPIRHPNKGVKKRVLRSIPHLTFTPSLLSSPSEGPRVTSDCPICLVEFVEGEEIRVLPQCGHVFHLRCVDTWLGSHSSCPSCRKVVEDGKKCLTCGATSDEAVARTTEDGGGGHHGDHRFLQNVSSTL